jgi:hypothetical protein
MNYTVKLDAKGAEIVSLPDVYLHFGHHDFDIVWNEETKRQDVVRGVDVFFGGMGEGSKYGTWQDAIHASLYDAFQVSEELKDGDTFVAEYRGEVARFACDGIHVVKLQEVL